MAQNTAVLGLKKPEGSDPFLASDFAANWQKIDDAIGQLQTSGGGGGTSGPHTHTEYAAIGHTHSTTGDGADLTNYYNKQESDARYAAASHGVHGGGGTEDATIVKSPGRTNPRVIFTTVTVTFNGVNGVGNITCNYAAANYPSVPQVLLSVQIGSNFDMIANVQNRLLDRCSVRVARVTGALTGSSSSPVQAQLFWMSIGV